MNRYQGILFFIIAAFVVVLPVEAQSGCVNSPENPTAVLAVVGTAGTVYSIMRGRWGARRQSRQR